MAYDELNPTTDSVGDHKDFCETSIHRSLDSICRTSASGLDEICVSDPYHRECAYATLAYDDDGDGSIDRYVGVCNTCLDHRPPPTTDGGNQVPYDGCSIEPPNCSPIIIKLTQGAYRLTGAESPVSFDIAAVGTPTRIGWTAPDSDEAFLWLDRDHDGRVGSGAELFGTATPLRNGRTASNGFIALAELDDDGNGVIDASDAVWPLLMLWVDRDHDGRSTGAEVTALAASDVTAIDLRHHWTGREDTHGNFYRYEAKASFRTAAGGERSFPIYDVFFRIYR